MSKHTVAPNELSIKALRCPETQSRVIYHIEGLKLYVEHFVERDPRPAALDFLALPPWVVAERDRDDRVRFTLARLADGDVRPASECHLPSGWRCRARVDWFNNRRLLEPIGNIPPAEAEANYYASLEDLRIAA